MGKIINPKDRAKQKIDSEFLRFNDDFSSNVSARFVSSDRNYLHYYITVPMVDLELWVIRKYFDYYLNKYNDISYCLSNLNIEFNDKVELCINPDLHRRRDGKFGVDVTKNTYTKKLDFQDVLNMASYQPLGSEIYLRIPYR